jgi:hypothetical protein
MSLIELEQEVQKLSPAEFSAFTRWLDDYAGAQWDDQFEKDVASGKFAKLIAKVDSEFVDGKCKEL